MAHLPRARPGERLGRRSGRPTTRSSTGSPPSRSRCCCSTPRASRSPRRSPPTGRPRGRRCRAPRRWLRHRPPAGRRAPGPLRRGRAAQRAGGTLDAARCQYRAAPADLRGPATGLDRSATARRAVAFGEVSLDAARTAGARHGATVNDVLLAASTIALGRALRRRGDAPGELKALVPVSVRGDGGARRPGQRDLVRDRRAAGRRGRPRHGPAPRPQPHAGAQGGRRRRAAAGVAQLGDLLPGRARRAVTRAAAGSAAFNCVVSNVPGRRSTSSCSAGASPRSSRPSRSCTATACRSARCPTGGACTSGSTPTPTSCPTSSTSPATWRPPSTRCACRPGPRDTPWRARAQRRRAATRRV